MYECIRSIYILSLRVYYPSKTLLRFNAISKFLQQHRIRPIYPKVLIYGLLSDLLICLRSISFFSRLSDFLDQRNVTIRNLLHKLWVRIKEHDMKVFNSMNTFQTPPIFEPDNLLSHTSASLFPNQGSKLTFSFPTRLTNTPST